MNCIQHPYKITTVCIRSKRPARITNEISEQRRLFNTIMKEWVANNDPNHEKWPRWFLNEFCKYWNTTPDHGKKTMYWMLSKKQREKWSTGGRLATCKRILYKNDPRWKTTQKSEKSHIYPGSFLRGGNQVVNSISNKFKI